MDSTVGNACAPRRFEGCGPPGERKVVAAKRQGRLMLVARAAFWGANTSNHVSPDASPWKVEKYGQCEGGLWASRVRREPDLGVLPIPDHDVRAQERRAHDRAGGGAERRQVEPDDPGAPAIAAGRQQVG